MLEGIAGRSNKRGSAANSRAGEAPAHSWAGAMATGYESGA
jgi:hypothetical protein